MAYSEDKKASMSTLWTTIFGKVDPFSLEAIIEEHRNRWCRESARKTRSFCFSEFPW